MSGKGATSKWRLVNRWVAKNADVLGGWSSLVAVIGLPILVLSGVLTFLQVRDYLERPDIALAFATAKDLRFSVVNTSSTLLREPQYSLNLWDFTARAAAPATAADPKAGADADPGDLMIPMQTVDFIRPNNARGPWTIEGVSRRKEPIPAGHVVFGWAVAQCPDCSHRRDYWVYVKKGESAWVAEMSEPEAAHVLTFLSRLFQTGAHFQELIDQQIPSGRRVAVPD